MKVHDVSNQDSAFERRRLELWMQRVLKLTPGRARRVARAVQDETAEIDW